MVMDARYVSSSHPSWFFVNPTLPSNTRAPLPHTLVFLTCGIGILIWTFLVVSEYRLADERTKESEREYRT